MSDLGERIKSKQTKSLPELFKGYQYQSPEELFQKVRDQPHIQSMLRSLSELDTFRLADAIAFFPQQFEKFNLKVNSSIGREKVVGNNER